MTRPNPNRAKVNRSYTVEEVARLYRVHRNTVRNWCDRGLPVLDGGRPALIQGRALRAFLQARRAQAKRPCPPGTIYCFRCREPRAPADGRAVFEVGKARAGTLKAICGTCGARMFRRAARASLPDILPGVAVQIVEAERHIDERPHPFMNCD